MYYILYEGLKSESNEPIYCTVYIVIVHCNIYTVYIYSTFLIESCKLYSYNIYCVPIMNTV